MKEQDEDEERKRVGEEEDEEEDEEEEEEEEEEEGGGVKKKKEEEEGVVRKEDEEEFICSAISVKKRELTVLLYSHNINYRMKQSSESMHPTRTMPTYNTQAVKNNNTANKQANIFFLIAIKNNLKKL